MRLAPISSKISLTKVQISWTNSSHGGSSPQSYPVQTSHFLATKSIISFQRPLQAMMIIILLSFIFYQCPIIGHFFWFFSPFPFLSVCGLDEWAKGSPIPCQLSTTGCPETVTMATTQSHDHLNPGQIPSAFFHVTWKLCFCQILWMLLLVWSDLVVPGDGEVQTTIMVRHGTYSALFVPLMVTTPRHGNTASPCYIARYSSRHPPRWCPMVRERLVHIQVYDAGV